MFNMICELKKRMELVFIFVENVGGKLVKNIYVIHIVTIDDGNDSKEMFDSL